MQTQELLNAWRKVSDFSSFIVLDTPEKHIEDFLKSNPLFSSCEDLKYLLNLFYDYVLSNNLGESVTL